MDSWFWPWPWIAGCPADNRSACCQASAEHSVRPLFHRWPLLCVRNARRGILCQHHTTGQVGWSCEHRRAPTESRRDSMHWYGAAFLVVLQVDEQRHPLGKGRGNLFAGDERRAVGWRRCFAGHRQDSERTGRHQPEKGFHLGRFVAADGRRLRSNSEFRIPNSEMKMSLLTPAATANWMTCLEASLTPNALGWGIRRSAVSQQRPGVRASGLRGRSSPAIIAAFEYFVRFALWRCRMESIANDGYNTSLRAVRPAGEQ